MLNEGLDVPDADVDVLVTVDLGDIEHTIRLLAAFVGSVTVLAAASASMS